MESVCAPYWCIGFLLLLILSQLGITGETVGSILIRTLQLSVP